MMSTAVLDSHPPRENGRPVEENWDSEDEAEEAEVTEVEEQAE